MPLKLPKLPDTHAVQLTASVVKYALFVVALAVAGSFVPRFLRSKLHIPEGNQRMRPAIGNRTIYELERSARLVEGDPRKAARPSQILHRGDVVVLGEGRRGEDILARVVALPGDILSIPRGGDLQVNGKSEKMYYLDSYASSKHIKMQGFARITIGDFHVPRGYIYCLIDVRAEGENRQLGLTNLREVRGKLILGSRDRGSKD